MLLLSLLFSSAMAAPLEPMGLVTVGAGFGMNAGTGTGGHSSGRVAFNLSERWSVEGLVAEGVVVQAEDLFTLGSIGFFGRFRFNDGWTGRLGFEHHHQTPWSVFTAEPVGALAGTAAGIAHRSGVELAVGKAWRMGGEDAASVLQRSQWLAEASASWLPTHGAPAVFVGVQVGATVDVGRPLARRDATL